MKKFISDIRGKTVTTGDGMILGVLDNVVIDTNTGEIQHLLIKPSDDLEIRGYQMDAKGRLVLPFKSMKAVKDVVVVDLVK